MEKVWRSPIARHRIRLNRGDIGFGQGAVMAWHEQDKGKHLSCLFKLKLTTNVKKTIAKIPWDHWQGKSTEGLVQLAEIRLKLNGWSCERRVIVERTLNPLNATPQGSFWQQCKEDFCTHVTTSNTRRSRRIQNRRPPLSAGGCGMGRSDMDRSGRRKIVKLAVGSKFTSFLKQACQRL